VHVDKFGRVGSNVGGLDVGSAEGKLNGVCSEEFQPSKTVGSRPISCQMSAFILYGFPS
jgi:hypothetical protein